MHLAHVWGIRKLRSGRQLAESKLMDQLVHFLLQGKCNVDVSLVLMYLHCGLGGRPQFVRPE